MIPTSYAAFERSVLEPLFSFRHDHDPDQLRASAAALLSLGRAGIDEARVSGIQRFRAVGWMVPSRRFRLSRRALARINPGYRIRIRRLPRRELGWRGRLFRSGFVVVAMGPDELPPFALRIVEPKGNLHQLPASNLEAAFALRTVNAAHPDLPVPVDYRGPLGFIDDVVISPLPAPDDRTTWLAALLHTRPDEVFEIVDSPHSGELGEVVARLFRAYPLNARWADRFAMSVLGSRGAYESDLTALRIVRFDGPAEVSADEAMLMPVLTRTGQAVTWKAGVEPVPIPSREWLHLPNATVQDGGTILCDGALVVYEHSADPSNDFVAGQWQTVFGSSANREIALVQARPLAERTIPEGILISGRNDNNWFHWLIEYLPRVLSIPDVIGPDVPIIVSTRTPASGRQALSELTARPIVELDPFVGSRFELIHVVAPPVQVHDTTKIPWQDGLQIDPRAIHRLQRAWGVGEVTPLRRRRIFLQRSSRHRGITNEATLAEVAIRHGLEVVDPGTLSFVAQREVFGSAELLVGASGAVMANYIMMRPGSTVVALTSDQLFDFVLPAALAQLAGVSFSYVTGPSTVTLSQVEDRNHWIHSDFSVDVAVFERELRAVIASLSIDSQSGGAPQ